MIYYLTLPFFLLLLVVLQSSISDLLLSGIVGVEISMILVLYAGFHLDIIKGGILSFVTGFILDCVSGSVSGLYAFTYVSLFLVSMTASMRISLDKASLIMIFTLICAFLEGVIITTLHTMIYRTDISVNVLRHYIPQMLVVALISPVFFHLFNRLDALLKGGHAK